MAFAAVRPPGHHATTKLCGGYCYVNNSAVSAAHIALGDPLANVIIVDVDHHHGNGTMEILARSLQSWKSRVRYVSIHSRADYPYWTSNMPCAIERTCSEDEYFQTLRRAIKELSFQYVVVSLGLDTYKHDPVGGLECFSSVEVYDRLGRLLANLFRHCKGVLFVLEGGYTDTLGTLVEAVLGSYYDNI